MSDSPPLPEAPGPGERRLAAILAMDVVGYSRMMEADEDATLARLRWLRQTLVEPHVAQHRGRVFKTMGDGLLVEFASAVDAVSAAVAIQQALAAAQIDALEDRTIRLRCGIHVGDIVSDGSDVLGDGVNLAARLEGIAEPGTVYVSRNVRDAARGAAQVEFEDLGERQVKNIQRPVQVYRVRLAGTKAASGPAAPGRSAGPDRLLPLLVGAVVLLAIGLAGIAWERGWLALAPARPAPWSAADMRQTFAIEPPILAAEDGTLRDYAGGLVEAMSAQFTPDLGDERLLPPQAAGTPAGVHFLVEIKLRHGGGDAVATVTLLDAASHDQLLVRTLTEPARPDLDPDRAALLGLVNDLKWAAIQREQVASEAIPPARRDARDLIILARFLQATEANELKLIADVEAARQLAPDDMHVLATVAFVLSWRVTDGLSKDPDTDLEQAQAAADRVLSHNPRQISALRAMDNVAMAQGRWEDEIVATDRVLEVAHNESTTMSHRCDAELRLGRIAAAAATLDRLLPFQTPGNAWFVGMLAARIRLGQGQYAESAEWSRKTAQLMPHDGSFAPELSILALYRASADGFLGNREDASRALADFAVLAPEIHGIAEIVKTETLPFPKAGLDRLLDGLRKAGMPE